MFAQRNRHFEAFHPKKNRNSKSKIGQKGHKRHLATFGFFLHFLISDCMDYYMVISLRSFWLINLTFYIGFMPIVHCYHSLFLVLYWSILLSQSHADTDGKIRHLENKKDYSPRNSED